MWAHLVREVMIHSTRVARLAIRALVFCQDGLQRQCGGAQQHQPAGGRGGEGQEKKGGTGKFKCLACGGQGHTSTQRTSRSSHPVDDGEDYEEGGAGSRR